MMKGALLISVITAVSSSDIENQVLGFRMGKCYAQQLDPRNASHLCENVLAQFDTDPPRNITDQTACLLSIADMLPVQYTVGRALMDCQTNVWNELFESPLGLDNVLSTINDRPTPAVAFWNPRYTPYAAINTVNRLNIGTHIVNYHHKGLALSQSRIPTEYQYLKMCYLDDMRSQLSDDDNGWTQFWDILLSRRWVWPYDKTYTYVAPLHAMPLSLFELVDDPMRSLTKYVRNVYGYIFCHTKGEKQLDFPQCKHNKMEKKWRDYPVELMWARFLMHHLPTDVVSALYDSTRHVSLTRQMSIFRDEAMAESLKLVVNASLASDMPGFNTEPWKIRTDYQLLDNGCDDYFQSRAEKRSHKGVASSSTILYLNSWNRLKGSKVGWMLIIFGCSAVVILCWMRIGHCDCNCGRKPRSKHTNVKGVIDRVRNYRQALNMHKDNAYGTF